jgi:hypothetical protein
MTRKLVKATEKGVSPMAEAAEKLPEKAGSD